MSRLVVFASVVSCILTGCSVYDSHRIDDPEQRPHGISYALPKGEVKISLKVNNATGRFTVVVGDPKYYADPEHAYVLSYNPSITAEDDITIEVDPHTTLLSSIQTKATDKLHDIILNAAKGAIAFTRGGLLEGGEVSPAAQEVVLIDHTVDPANMEDVAWLQFQLDTHARSYARRMRDRICPDATEEADAACAAFADVAQARKGRGIQFSVDRPRLPPVQQQADCSIGVCYRPTMPYRINFSIGAYTHSSTVVLLPNDSPPIAMDLARAFFVEKVTNITFQDGFIKTVHVTKGSELLEASKLPLEIAKAMFSVPQDLFTLKTGATDAEIKAVNKQIELLKARQQLDDEIKKAAKPDGTPITESGDVSRRTQQGYAASNPVPPSGGPDDLAAGNIADPQQPITGNPTPNDNDDQSRITVPEGSEIPDCSHCRE